MLDDSALTHESEGKKNKICRFPTGMKRFGKKYVFFPYRAFYLEKSHLPTDSNTTAMKIDQVKTR